MPYNGSYDTTGVTLAIPKSMYVGNNVKGLEDTDDVLAARNRDVQKSLNDSEVMLSKMKVAEPDSWAVQNALDSFNKLTSDIKETGRYENGVSVAVDVAKDIAMNKGLATATQQKKLLDDQMVEAAKAYKEGLIDEKMLETRKRNQKTYGGIKAITDADGKVIDYTTDYRDDMPKGFNGVEAINKYFDKTLTDTWTEINGTLLKKGVDKNGNTVIYKQTQSSPNGKDVVTETTQMTEQEYMKMGMDYLDAHPDFNNRINYVKTTLDAPLDKATKSKIGKFLEGVGLTANQYLGMTDQELYNTYERKLQQVKDVLPNAQKYSFTEQKLKSMELDAESQIALRAKSGSGKDAADEFLPTVPDNDIHATPTGAYVNPHKLPTSIAEHDTELASIGETQKVLYNDISKLRVGYDTLPEDSPARADRDKQINEKYNQLQLTELRKVMIGKPVKDSEEEVALEQPKLHKKYQEVSTQLNKLVLTKEEQEALATMAALAASTGRLGNPKNLDSKQVELQILNDLKSGKGTNTLDALEAGYSSSYDNEWGSQYHKDKTTYNNLKSKIEDILAPAKDFKHLVDLKVGEKARVARQYDAADLTVDLEDHTKTSRFSSESTNFLKRNLGTFKILSENLKDEAQPLQNVLHARKLKAGEKAEDVYDIQVTGMTTEPVGSLGYLPVLMERWVDDNGTVQTKTHIALPESKEDRRYYTQLAINHLRKNGRNQLDSKKASEYGTVYNDLNGYADAMDVDVIDNQTSYFQSYPSDYGVTYDKNKIPSYADVVVPVILPVTGKEPLVTQVTRSTDGSQQTSYTIKVHDYKTNTFVLPNEAYEKQFKSITEVNNYLESYQNLASGKFNSTGIDNAIALQENGGNYQSDLKVLKGTPVNNWHIGKYQISYGNFNKQIYEAVKNDPRVQALTEIQSEGAKAVIAEVFNNSNQAQDKVYQGTIKPENQKAVTLYSNSTRPDFLKSSQALEVASHFIGLPRLGQFIKEYKTNPSEALAKLNSELASSNNPAFEKYIQDTLSKIK